MSFATERKRKICSSDSEEDESSSSDAMEGEKENENVCNEGGSSVTPERTRTRVSQKRSQHTNQSGVYRGLITPSLHIHSLL